MSSTTNPYRDDAGTLRNKLGISDPQQLREVEYQLTRIRALELYESPIKGDFDLAHLKAIHKHLFSDVYEWAGQERSVNISKRSLTEPGWKTVFAPKDGLEAAARVAHAQTSGSNHLKGMDSEAFAEGLSRAYEKWNHVHPFPEGNGRALNVMLSQMAREAGHTIDWRRVPGDFWLDAAETSATRVKIDDPRQRRDADLTEIRELFEYMVDPKPDRAVELSQIRLNQYEQADRNNVQAAVVRAVQADPSWFVDRYKADTRSFDGRYVAADLFKEMFDEFAASKESRNRYNGPVHNSAAVLSAELFRENLATNRPPEQSEVIFLTGTPGAGKTSSVLCAGEMPASCRMIFEGQLSDPVTSIAKIQQSIDAGLMPVIVAVHARPEDALQNTLKRFEEQGRGASIQVMSSIQGKLPDSLREIQKQFGDAVELTVVDVRDRAQVKTMVGWEHLEILRSEGTHEQIKERLSKALERGREAGHIGEAAYRQAAGLAPLDRNIGLAEPSRAGARSHAPVGDAAPVRGVEAVVTPVVQKERER